MDEAEIRRLDRAAVLVLEEMHARVERAMDLTVSYRKLFW